MKDTAFFGKTIFAIFLLIIFIIFINVSVYFFVTDFVIQNEKEKIAIYSSFVVSNLKKVALQFIDQHNEDKIYKLIEDNIGELNKYQWQIIVVNRSAFVLYDSQRNINKITENERDYSKDPAVREAFLGSWDVRKIYIDDEFYYTISDVVPFVNWIVIFKIRESIFLKKIHRLVVPQFVFSFLVIVAIIITAIIFIKRVLTPIEILTDNLKRYGDGEAVSQLNVSSGKRVNEAIYAFNSMVKEKDELEEEVLKIAERERERIGIDLHDELGQILTGVSFQLMSLKDELKEKSHLKENIDYIGELITLAISKVRSISKMLFPVIEDNILVTIEELIKNFIKVYNVKIDFLYEEEFFVKDNFVGVNLYHIIMEALTNAVKHGKANHIKVLVKSKDKFSLEIIDNGSGFDVNQKSSGIGLKNIKYRAKIIGGKVNISSEIGKGSCLKLELKERGMYD